MPGLHDIIDKYAATQPEVLAVLDEDGVWNYLELRDASLRIASSLNTNTFEATSEPCWESRPFAPRPLAIAMARGRKWYAVCIASWRLGVPVVAISTDMPDKVAEQQRNACIAQGLIPWGLILDPGQDADSILPGRPLDCLAFTFDDLMEAAGGLPPVSSSFMGKSFTESALCYVYTGGTTKHSKCVLITHSMALWEMENYATALHGSANCNDRMLQYSSSYWGAAVFGQLDLALAFGACAVIVPTLRRPDAISDAVQRHRITVLGIVPSQLRGAWPGGPTTKPPFLRVLISWAEKLPMQVAREWKTHVQLFELLIASEYWLALHSDCSVWRDPADGSERHIFEALPKLDMLLLREDGTDVDEGQIGELFLAGSTVSPGYVGEDRRIGSGPQNDASFKEIHGRRFYRTRDRLRLLPGGGMVYCGRSDALLKRGGAWVDLDAAEAVAAAEMGVTNVAILNSERCMDVFLAVEHAPDGTLLQLLDRVRHTVGGETNMHVRSELPLHPATAKVDRRTLQSQLAMIHARESHHKSRLRCVQGTMLRYYTARYLILVLLFATTEIFRFPLHLSLLNSFSSITARLILLPYAWAALSFGLVGTPIEKRFWKLPIGLQELPVLLTLSLPVSCLGPVATASGAYIIWTRHRHIHGVVGSIAASLVHSYLVRGGGAFPCTSIFLAISTLALATPINACFLASLPICCYMSLPKWLGDDSRWHSGRSRIRGMLTGFFKTAKPPWDGSLVWEPSSSYIDWGWRRPNVWTSSKRSGLAIQMGFHREVDTSQNRHELLEKQATLVPATLLTHDCSNILAASLATFAERAGAHGHSLASLDSLKAITFTEMVRKEMGITISVADVLRCEHISQLATCVESAKQDNVDATDCNRGPCAPSDKLDGSYRVHMMMTRTPVDWCVRYGGPGHLDIAVLQRAVNRLVERHSALRVLRSPDLPLRSPLEQGAAMWQLWTSCVGGRSPAWNLLSNIVSGALFTCWPRTLLSSAVQARFQIKVPKAPVWVSEDEKQEDTCALKCIHDLIGSDFRWPCDVCVVPVCRGLRSKFMDESIDAVRLAAALPIEDVSWYIHVSVTHCYSDGLSGQALVGDLLRMYAEEARTPPIHRGLDPPVPEHLGLLQHRLRKALRGRQLGDHDANGDMYIDSLCEDWGMREGMSRRILIGSHVSNALRTAATSVLGCSIDVAWLTAVAGTLFRLFPREPRIDFALKCACRDGPGETQMVGFLCQQRNFHVDVGDSGSATLLGIASMINQVRRTRQWHAPAPFEAGLVVHVNIVSAMLTGLPTGVRHVLEPADWFSQWWTVSYNHISLRIDQLGEIDWELRLCAWDAAWGWNWSTYFAQGLGSTIEDMVRTPTGPLLQRHEPLADNEWQASSKRKRNRIVEMAGDDVQNTSCPGSESPAKLLRSGDDGSLGTYTLS